MLQSEADGRAVCEDWAHAKEGSDDVMYCRLRDSCPLQRNVMVRRPHRIVASCSRKRKAAQAARDVRAEEGSDDDDMFGFINKQLAGPGGPPAAESGRKLEPPRKVLFLLY
jgi:hypothetical protein